MAEAKAVEEAQTNCSKLKTFYTKHFPTDSYTYRLRIPFLGLIVSLLSLEIVNHFISGFYRLENSILFYGIYIFIAVAVNCELHYGFKTLDRTQLTPWLLFKYIEILIAFLSFLIDFFGPLYCWENFFWYEGVIIALNVVVTRTVLRKSKEFEKMVPSEKISPIETV